MPNITTNHAITYTNGTVNFQWFFAWRRNLFFSSFTIISDRNHNIPTGKLQLATKINKVINFIGETHLLHGNQVVHTVAEVGEGEGSPFIFLRVLFSPLTCLVFATSLLSESMAQAMQPAKHCLESAQQNSARTQPPGQSSSRYLWVMSFCTPKHSPTLWGDIPS